MEIIYYDDIDFRKLIKLDIQNQESDIYLEKNKRGNLNIYRIFKSSLSIYELLLKNEKLKQLENIDQKLNILIPNARIMDSYLVGTREDYIDGIYLNYSPLIYDYSDILKMLLSISENLQSIHENGIIVSNLTLTSIKIDKQKNHYFMDPLSYSINHMYTSVISDILALYLKRNNKIINPSKNNDKITLLILSIQIFVNKHFFDITEHDFDKVSREVKFLTKLKEIFLNLQDSYVEDAPYLHELFSETK